MHAKPILIHTVTAGDHVLKRAAVEDDLGYVSRAISIKTSDSMKTAIRSACTVIGIHLADVSVLRGELASVVKVRNTCTHNLRKILRL